MKIQKITLSLMTAAVMCGTFMLSGCVDDVIDGIPEGAMIISTEGVHGDAKTTVNNTAVYWQENDAIKINGSNASVMLNDGTPYLMNIDNSSAMYAGFPADIASVSGTTVTLNLPSSYNYETAGGRQKLDLPMVAYAAAGATELHFKHVCATINVSIMNNLTAGYCVDKIVVASQSEPVCGSASVVPSSGDPTITAPTYSRGTNDTVKMLFPDEFIVSPSGNRTVQIPVLATTNESVISVRIEGHPTAALELNTGKLDAAVRINYQNSISAIMGRAYYFTAPCTIKGSGPTIIKKYPSFSVSSTKKVNFSKGNLQYAASGDVWSFADQQYTVLGDQNATGRNTIDLFGWGTKTTPMYVVTNDGAYSWNEWGENTISNASLTGWRTLTMAEWHYLLADRSCSTVAGTANARYVKCRLNFIPTHDGFNAPTNGEGVIVFPDNFVCPTDVESKFTGNVNNRETTYGAPTLVSITSAEWTKLETAGCVFLPTTGIRTGLSVAAWSNGIYWTSTNTYPEAAANSNKADCIKFTDGQFYYNNSSTSATKSTGAAVRLVIDE